MPPLIHSHVKRTSRSASVMLVIKHLQLLLSWSHNALLCGDDITVTSSVCEWGVEQDVDLRKVKAAVVVASYF